MLSSKRLYVFNLLMSVLPNSGCQRMKAALLRWAGASVGQEVEIFQGVKIQGVGELEIGDRAFIGHETLFLLNEGSRIIVEESAIVSSRCLLVTGFHPITPDGERILSREGTSSTIRIGQGSCVLVGSIILPGVSVGQKGMVAAGATVTKDVPPYAMVGGCPARLIKMLR